MNMLTTKNVALTLVPGLLAALLIQACGGGSVAVAQTPPENDPIEGAWESSVTIRDCTSGNPLRSFKGLTVLHRGGTATATNNLPPAGNGPAVGTWKRNNGPTGYTATFRFYRFNADGSFAGAQKLSRNVTLAADGNALTGTISAQVLDAADNVLQEVCGTEAAVRVATIG